jgi:hypothetical protein
METSVKIRRITTLIPTVAVLFSISACDRTGSGRKPEKAWVTTDLTNYAKVDWNPTNAIPLSPDAAVRAALKHLGENHGTNISWRVSSIHLESDKFYPSYPWMYQIECESGQAGDRDYKWETVRVLLSGEVWKQRKVE